MRINVVNHKHIFHRISFENISPSKVILRNTVKFFNQFPFSPEANLFPKKFKFTPSCWFFLTHRGSKLYSGVVPGLFSRSNLWNRFRFKSVRYLPFKLYLDTFILPYFFVLHLTHHTEATPHLWTMKYT